MKIVYCLNSIRYLGGIQRVTVVKANALAEIDGNDVYIIVTDNKDGVITEPLSDKVHLIDLDVNYYSDDWKSKWNVLKGIFAVRAEHKKKLKKVLNDIQPDFVISVGQSEKYFLLDIPGKWKRIREMHFNKNYRKIHAISVFDRILARVSDLYDYGWKIKKYDQIVVLTHEEKENNWKGFKNVTIIPNPSSFKCDEPAKFENNQIISVGRLEAVKNFSSLIHAFQGVVGQHPEWKLEIYGDGCLKQELNNLISDLNLENNVYLKGFCSNIKEKLQDSSMFVFTSICEGFGLVLIEAMSCGLPVVSYSCPCGPKDIISDGKDGFLIPVNDEKHLADRINYLIENKEKRIEMGKNAIAKASHYQADEIARHWMALFERLKCK